MSADLQLLWPQISLQPVSLWFLTTRSCWMAPLTHGQPHPHPHPAPPPHRAWQCQEGPVAPQRVQGGGHLGEKRFAQSSTQLFVHCLNDTVKEAAQTSATST